MSEADAGNGHERGAFEVERDSETEILTLRFQGPLTLGVARAALDAISTEAQGFSTPKRLWDVRESQVHMTPDEVKNVARLSQGRDRSGFDSRLAIIVGDDEAYGLGRLHQVFRQSDAIVEKIFRDENEARAWLTSDARE